LAIDFIDPLLELPRLSSSPERFFY
jgi:hypothetical protein